MNEIPKGLCQCGCGRRTTIAKLTDRRRGVRKGEPVRFCVGHQKGPDYSVEDRGFVTPCWVWQGSTNEAGYALKFVDGQRRVAHRVLWERANGCPVPEGLELDHLCRVTACVNPEHVEPVTHAENLRRGSCTKLTRADVRAIRSVADDYPRTVLAERYGVTATTILRIIQRKLWPDV